MLPSLVIGVISDGKPGHLNQSLGLAEALQRLRPGAALRQINALPTAAALAALLLPGRTWDNAATRGRDRVGDELATAQPDLLIAAGHRTHLTLLALQRRAACPAIVLMRPSLPRRCFDLCIEPRHDGGREAPGVLLSDGPLNRMQRGVAVADTGVILLGGPSQHYHWDDASLLRQIECVCDGGGRWELSTSRRTPPSLVARLQALEHPNLRVHCATDLPPDWLARALPAAERCWVTPDSASMVYEALTAGCAVGLFELEAVAGSRVARGVDALESRALVTGFAAFAAGQPLRSPGEVFAEADRCARQIVERGWL